MSNMDAVEMHRLILPVILFCSAYSKDSCNGTEVNGLCYWIIHENLSFNHANSRCMENNGTLAEIPDAESNIISSNLANESTTTWIGLSLDKGRWVNMNNLTTNYKAWRRKMHEVADNTNKTHCVALNSEALMHATKCKGTINFLCSYQTTENCSDFMTHFGDSCFWKHNSSLTFWTAEKTCQEGGGHLASIPDSPTLSFIQRRFLTEVPTKYMWIGIHFIKENGTYANMFNAIQNFTQWDEKEPFVPHYFIYICVATKHFEWFTSPCNSKHPAICSRRTACRGSELPMNTSSQLMHPFNVDVTEIIFELEAEVKLKYGKTMIIMHCGRTGYWESDTRTYCLCPCSRVHVSASNITVQKKILEIKQELKLNKIQLSKTRRQKISSSDSRPSAFVLGSVLGAGIITTFFLLVVICDLPSLLQQINSRHRLNMCR